MTKKILMLSLPFIFFAEASQAANCTDLKSCANAMFELSGQRYIWEAKSEKQIVSSPDIELTKDTGDIVFTALLDQSGLARAPVGDGKTFRIVTGAYRKEMEMPTLNASAESKPEFPATWDWIGMRYKTKTPELAVHIESMYRLHLPREARMQADYNGSFLLLQGPAPLMRQMYETIRAADIPHTAAVRKYMEARKKERKLEQQQMKNSKN